MTSGHRSDPGLGAALRWPLAGTLLLAAAAHVPVIPEHLREAPYMGVAFIAFTVVAAATAVVVALRDSAAVYAFAAVLCAAAVAMYVATRLVAFPQLADDVGNWTETLGLVSISAETAAVLLAGAVLRPWSPLHVRTSRPA